MRSRRLGDIVGPSPVEVRGWIASPESVRSPVTGRSAALIAYWLFVPGRLERRAGRGTYDRLVGEGIWGEPLVIVTADGRLWVPLDDLTPYFPGANAEEHPLIGPLPAPLAHLRDEPGSSALLEEGALYYRELTMASGRAVRVRGTASPVEGDGAYRRPAHVEFVLRGDREPATLSIDVPEMA